MDYDISKIKTIKKVINGKEVEVKVIPEGMHGQGWKPDLFEEMVDAGVETEFDDPEDEVLQEEIDEEDLVSRYEKLMKN